MKKYLSGFLGFIAIVMLSSCSYNQPNIVVPIDPQVQAVHSRIGNQQTVAVNVVNSRKQQTIGFTNGMEAMFKNSVWIEPANNMMQVIQTKLENGIRAQGFVPVQMGPGEPRQLVAKLLDINYVEQSAGAASSIHRFKVIIEVDAKNGTKQFKRIYHADTTYKTPWFLSKDQLTEYTNQTIAIALNNIFNDGELWSFLRQ